MRTVEFKVMAIATATEDEAEYCYVNEDTEILCEEGETLKVCTHAISLLLLSITASVVWRSFGMR